MVIKTLRAQMGSKMLTSFPPDEIASTSLSEKLFSLLSEQLLSVKFTGGLCPTIFENVPTFLKVVRHCPQF